LFFVHFENGATFKVYPSTAYGEKLLSACEDVLNNLSYRLRLIIEDKDLVLIKNESAYIEITLKDTYNFTVYAKFSNTVTKVVSKTIIIILSKQFEGLVLFDGVNVGEERLWGANWKIDTNSTYFKKLKSITDEIKI